MHTYYPQGDIGDAFAFLGYSNAALFAEVLRRCGDNLARENLLAVASHLQGVRMPALLPGISLNTSPTDYDPLKQMRLQRFDGDHWPVPHRGAGGLKALGLGRRVQPRMQR